MSFERGWMNVADVPVECIIPYLKGCCIGDGQKLSVWLLVFCDWFYKVDLVDVILLGKVLEIRLVVTDESVSKEDEVGCSGIKSF